MKNLKFALIAAFLSLALAGYSTDYKKDVVRTIKITINQAMDERGLVREMYIQLNEKTFLKERTKLYVARIKYRKNLYLIQGTYKEWESFFLMDNLLPPGFESAVGSQSRLIN
jgi:hypothetical protein